MQKFNPESIKHLGAANTLLEVFYHTKKSHEPLQLNKAKEILIIDPELIGDIVMLIPFLKAIRKTAANAVITLVCASWARVILSNQELADEYVVVDNKLLNSPKMMMKKWRTIRSYHKIINKKTYDIAIEPRGDLRYIFFMHFCKADRKVSYNYTGGEHLLTDVIKPSQTVNHLIEDKMFLAKELGCAFNDADSIPVLNLSQEQLRKNDEFRKDHNIGEKLIIGIHPGASIEYRKWAHYSELISSVKNDSDVTYLVFSGKGEEEAAEKICVAGEKAGKQCIHVHESFEDYLRIIGLCDIVVCNDSGAAHLSAAYGSDVIILFGPNEPIMTRAFGRGRIECISHKLPCKPCMSDKCVIGGNECINSIKMEEVLKPLEEVIEQVRRDNNQ